MDDGTPLDGLSSLVQLSGVSVPARARFIGEALVTSSLSSVTLGLSWGMVGAMTPLGPLVPFLVGSWLGYTFGLVNHWRTSHRVAMHTARHYPTLLVHALATERFIVVPRHVVEASEAALTELQQQEEEEQDQQEEGESRNHDIVLADTSNRLSSSVSSDPLSPLEEWISQGGWGRLSWSILAAQTCRGDVEELQRQKRQKLMEEHTERYG